MSTASFDLILANFFLSVFILDLKTVCSQTPVKLLFVMESEDNSIKSLLNDALPTAEKDFGGDLVSIDAAVVEVDRENIDGSHQRVCAALFEGVTLILDMTWTGWDKLKKVAVDNGIIYRRADAAIIPYVQAFDDLLIMKNSTDVALIFENERDLNLSLYYLIGNSIIRLVVIDELDEVTVAKVRAMRPSPSYYAIYAKTANMERLFKTALEGGIAKRNDIWNLIFIDFNYRNFKYISGNGNLNVTLGIVTMNTDVCCRMIGEMPCVCPSDFEIFPYYLKRVVALLVETLAEVVKSGSSVETTRARCEEKNGTANLSNATVVAFGLSLLDKIAARNDVLEYLPDRTMISYRAEIEVETLRDGNLEKIGNWTKKTGITVAPGQKIPAAKRFFRVGTTEAIPWTTLKRDPATGEPMKDAQGRYIWEGYCMEFLGDLARIMHFDYELVFPTDGTFGDKLPGGKWSGVVGDLARGDTDMVVAALTMTSEREEVIDFVAPFFAQSGILIGSIKYK